MSEVLEKEEVAKEVKDVKEIKKETPVAKEENVEIDKGEIRTFGESMSSEIGGLAGALSVAQGAMSNGSKDKQGYGYKYMELGTLTDIIRPELAKNGLAVIQGHELNRDGKNPSVLVHTTIMHKSGQWFKNSLDIPISNMKQLSMAQMMGVSMTYGRRYALQSLFMIASEEDTDGASK
jgi:hypothetical protein